MRKSNPDDVRADFAAGLADVVAFYNAADAVVTGDKNKTLLVEHTFLAAAVLWESFVSDLLIAYVNRDASRFTVHLRAALETDLGPKQREIYTRYATLAIPQHIRKADVVSLIDANGNNITFSNFAALEDAAGRWLAPAHAGRITGRSNLEKATVNAAISIRNHIAHRSQRSLAAMNAALANGVFHNTGRGRGPNEVRHVGSFLKAVPVGMQDSRITLYLNAVGGIAAAL
ncbi:MAG: hypothetical protein JNK47_15850 [Mesorhizobium sp.]|nr:hypothetical protein [Mesorhizobium sp.]MBL8578696.1 hypothetical protein [Mesorhizobium sp.]